MSLLNLKTWVHYYVALLKRLGPIKFSLLLAMALIVADALLQIIITYFFAEPLVLADLYRSVILGLIITPWAVYFLTVVVDDLDNAREHLKLTVSKLESISIDDKAKTDLLEKEIEEHQKTQQQLREGSSLLRSFLDTSPDLIFHRNLSGEFVSCNEAMEALFGKTEAELVGLLPKDIYSAEYAKEVDARHKKVIETRTEQIHASWLQYPNGRMAYFEIRALPLLNSQQECIGLIGFGREITERKKHQEFLEKASRDKTTFISTISHELRTPLNGIVGLSRMLLDENLNQEQTKYLKTIHMSAITLGNIFNDIVDLDKLDRRRLNLVNNNINVYDFMNDLQSLAYIQAEQKQLKLNFELGELPEFITSDDTRLRQVLWNLITNAVKFTEKGEVTIRCSSYSEKDKNWLCFEVQDTGIGIPENKLDKIFAMYYQVKGNRNASGTGIGLAVSNKIVTAMNGRLTVTSELGKGSTFKLCLPNTFVAEQTAVSSPQVPTLSILLVEDIELNIIVARALLEKQGHKVDVAMSGQEAFDKVDSGQYQLILMDIQLPDFDGYEVTRQLKARFNNLPPIVALTANVFSSSQQFIDKGLDDAIGKPLSLTLFNAMLDRHFSDEKSIIQNDTNIENLNVNIEEEPLFNEVMLKELMEFLPTSVMLNNVQLFESLMPEYLAILESHMIAKNKDGIVTKSHKIKGAAAAIGLLRIQDLAQKMQSPDLPAWWDNIDDWHELIKSFYLKDIKALKKWIVENS